MRQNLILSFIATFFLVGCGESGNIKTQVPMNEINFTENGVFGNIYFEKENKYDPNSEKITVTSITADECEVNPISLISVSLTKNNPHAEIPFSINFKKSPCYTDKINVDYTQQILDAKDKKNMTIINPQYSQKNVFLEKGTDPLYKYQWHLKNKGQDFGIIPAKEGEDIDVENVWKNGITGKGVVVAVIDTGVDMFHPDLKDNIDWKDSYNYLIGTHNTTPLGDKPNNADTDQYNFAHGTAVAGLIAAKGWNGIGTRGVAPDAKIAAMNSLVLLKGQVSEDGYSESSIPSIQTVRMLDSLVKNLNHIDIYNNSWGGDATTLIDDYLLRDAIDYDIQTAYGVKFGRNGKGVIYVKSAGNDGANSNANFEQLQTNGNWIVVGAVGADGNITSYSTPGSAILISAPGGAVNPDYTKQNKLEIVTTDLAGKKRGFDRNDIYATSMPHFDVKGNENYDYTDFMNGTSAAAPIVSGVIALILQTNPNLTYRDIKIILAKSARKNDPNNEEWHVNAAGLHYNYKYGFGVIDALKAVEMAKNFKSVGTYRDLKIVSNEINKSIISSKGELNVTIPIENSITIEDVKLYLSIDSNQSKNIEIVLISPSGTKSILVKAPNSLDSNDTYSNVRLLSTNFMLENSKGNWVLNLNSIGRSEFNLTNVILEITGH